MNVAPDPIVEPVYGIGLCAGAGGLELGLEIALPGYRSVCMVEREIAVAGRLAARISEGSIPEVAIWDDVTTFDGVPWRGIVSILSAGFPCQPFSVAGKRKGTGDERWIWPDIARIIGETRPDICFLENVPGLLLDPDRDFDRWEMDGEPTDALGGMGTVLRSLAELGFACEWTSIRASDVGASHGRKRVFILAYRNGGGRQTRGPLGILRSGSESWNGSTDGGEPMADAGFARIRGTAEPAGFDRSWTPDDDWRTSGALADTGDGQLSEPGRGSEKRNGFGSGGAALGEPASAGPSLGRDDRELRQRPAPERTGGELGDTGCGSTGRLQSEPERERSEAPATQNPIRELEHAAGGRFGELREPSGPGGGFPDGSNENVGNPENGDGRISVSAEWRQNSEPARAGDGISIFAPGPAAPIWKYLLVQRPWLRPSWSQAEAESYFRDVVNGLAPLVATERTGALRTLGNGVVPLQAAFAFVTLARRILNRS